MVLTPDMILIYTTPTSSLTMFQKGVFYYGIKVFSHLPCSIKSFCNEEKQFRLASKRFLLMNSLYVLDEYFNGKLPKDIDSL